MKFTKGHPLVERVLTQGDRDRIWELYFGKRYSYHRIALEYGCHDSSIIGAIDSESARRWKEKHPHETNREHLFIE